MDRAKFYMNIFGLKKEPKILTQCCNDNPLSKNGRGCMRGLLEHAQRFLDKGFPVVIEFFGRRLDYRSGKKDNCHGTFFMTDTITVYEPGQKIDPELFKKNAESNLKNYFLPPNEGENNNLKNEEKEAVIKEAKKNVQESLNN